MIEGDCDGIASFTKNTVNKQRIASLLLKICIIFPLLLAFKTKEQRLWEGQKQIEKKFTAWANSLE
jgi:hypothetical protein